MPSQAPAAPKYRFEQGGMPYAWNVFDAATGLPAGSVFANIGSGFTYQTSRWDGRQQVFDSVRAETLEAMSEAIADLKEKLEDGQ